MPRPMMTLADLSSEEVQFINPGVMAVGVQELPRSSTGESICFKPHRDPTNEHDRCHHDHFHNTWARPQGERVEAEGLDLGQAGADGRIVRSSPFMG